MASKAPTGPEGNKTGKLKDIYAKVIPRHLRRRTVHESSFKENTPQGSSGNSWRRTVASRDDLCNSETVRSQPRAHDNCPTNDVGETDGHRSGSRRCFSVEMVDSVWGTAVWTGPSRLETHLEEDADAQCSEENGQKTKIAPPKPPRRSLSREEWCPPNLSKPFCGSSNSIHAIGMTTQPAKVSSQPQHNADVKSSVKPHSAVSSQPQHHLDSNMKAAVSPKQQRGLDTDNTGQKSRPRGISRQSSMTLDEGRTVTCPATEGGVAVVTVKQREIPAKDVARGYVCLSEHVSLVGNADAKHLRPPLNPHAETACPHERISFSVDENSSPKQRPRTPHSPPSPDESSLHESDKSTSSGELTEKEHFTGVSVGNPTYHMSKADLKRFRNRNATDDTCVENENKREKGEIVAESPDGTVAENKAQKVSESLNRAVPDNERQTASTDRTVPDSNAQRTPEASNKNADVESPENNCTEDHSSIKEHPKPPAVCRTISSESSASTTSREYVLCADDTLTVLQTCSTCLQICSDPRLLLCFHIVCPECVEAHTEERDNGHVIVCLVCGKEQASTAEGPTSLTDIYPGILSETFGASSCSLNSQYEEVYPSNRAPLARSASSAGAAAAKADPEITRAAGLLQRRNSCPAESGKKTCQPHPQTQNESADKADTSYKRQNYKHQKESADKSDASHHKPGVLHPKHTTSPSNFQTVKTDLEKSSFSASSVTLPFSDKKKRGTSSSSTTQNLSKENNPNFSSSSPSLSSASKAKLCGACQTRSDTFHTCVSCGGIMLCEACRMAHQNLPVTRSHEVLPVSTTPVSPLMILARRQPTCHIHGQDIALTCATCGIFICHRCTVPHHSRHEIKELSTLHQTKRKQLVTLQRTIKQHVLAARSARRSLDDQLAKVEASRQSLCTSIQTTAERCVQRFTSEADDLTKEVQQRTAERRTILEKNRAAAKNSQREGQKLRCVLEAVTEQTPHLTSLALLHTCQARYDALRGQAQLSVEDSDDMVFCKNRVLETLLQGQDSLGSLRTLISGVSDNVMTVMRTFRVFPELSGLAVTPYGEVVCISAETGRCQVWDIRGEMLVDASRHFQRPSAVRTTPSGVIFILDEDTTSGHGKGGPCCLKLLSPAGTLLSKIPLTTAVNATKFHCVDDRTVIVSDELRQTVCMYSLEKGSVEPRLIRTVKHQKHLIAPRHVNVNITGDWVISENGATLQVVSPFDEVTTLLCTDEIDAVLQPPRRTARGPRLVPIKSLGDVCCDSRGRVIAADLIKCGIYVITGGEVSKKEHNFVLLKELSPSAKMAAICLDDQDKIYVGMSDGMITVLRIGPPCSSE